MGGKGATSEPLFRPAGLDTDGNTGYIGETPFHLNDVLAEWGYTAADLDMTHAFTLVQPIAHLVCCRRWEWLVWLGDWQAARQVMPAGFLTDEWLRKATGTIDSIPTADICPESIESLMNNLRRWLPSILAMTDDEDALSEKFEVVQALSWLERLRK